MPDRLTPPAAPENSLETGGWELAEEYTETVFELPAMRVQGVTRRYEDERSRARLRERAGGDLEHPVRFFAVTRLVFEPPLPPGVGTAMVAPTVRSEARKAFARRLEERGLEDVTRDRSERFRLPDRTSVRLWRYTAADPLPQLDSELPLECWVAIWTGSDALFVVTGGHPTVALASLFPDAPESEALTRSPSEFRDAFLELLRETGREN